MPGISEAGSAAPSQQRIPLVESCVTTIREALDSQAAGADRLELCVDLTCGGLTPPLSLVSEAVRAVTIPVFALIRPRPGDFVFTRDETTRMVASVEGVLAQGASGVVIGALAPGDLGFAPDLEATARLVRHARGAPVTFHRAIDACTEVADARHKLGSVGVDRVLTSGGAGSAWDGRAVLARMVASAGPVVLVAGGVRADHVAPLIATTACREIHARASAVPALCSALSELRGKPGPPVQ